MCALIFASLSIDFADSEGFGGVEGVGVGGGMLRSRLSLAAVSSSRRIHSPAPHPSLFILTLVQVQGTPDLYH